MSLQLLLQEPAFHELTTFPEIAAAMRTWLSLPPLPIDILSSCGSSIEASTKVIKGIRARLLDPIERRSEDTIAAVCAAVYHSVSPHSIHLQVFRKLYNHDTSRMDFNNTADNTGQLPIHGHPCAGSKNNHSRARRTRRPGIEHLAPLPHPSFWTGRTIIEMREPQHRRCNSFCSCAIHQDQGS